MPKWLLRLTARHGFLEQFLEQFLERFMERNSRETA